MRDFLYKLVERLHHEERRDGEDRELAMQKADA